jgi:hypothetical protein
VNPCVPPTAPAAVRDALTEADGLPGGDPAELPAGLPGQPSGRKRLLFTCACRRVGDLLTGPLSRKAIEAAERCAGGAGGAGVTASLARGMRG